MLIGYARVSKADGSQSLDLQRDPLQAAAAAIHDPETGRDLLAAGRRGGAQPAVALHVATSRVQDSVSTSHIEICPDQRARTVSIQASMRGRCTA